MKFSMALLAIILSANVFASAEDCKALTGKYNCEFQGEKVPLILKANIKKNSFSLQIADEGEEYIVDGKARPSSRDDSQNVVICHNRKELIIDNYFRGEIKGSISIATTQKGVLYTMVKSSSTLELNCVRIR